MAPRTTAAQTKPAATIASVAARLRRFSGAGTGDALCLAGAKRIGAAAAGRIAGKRRVIVACAIMFPLITLAQMPAHSTRDAMQGAPRLPSHIRESVAPAPESRWLELIRQMRRIIDASCAYALGSPRFLLLRVAQR